MEQHHEHNSEHSHSGESNHNEHHTHHTAYSAIPQLENWLEEVNKKAPQLPKVWRENIAKYSPWITLVILVVTLPVLFALLGVGEFVFTMARHYGYYHAGFGLAPMLMVGSLILEAIALPALFKRSKQGWVFIFYANLLF